MSGKLLEMRGLTVEIPTPSGPVALIRGFDLEVGEREIVGIVGESGSGKSLSMRAALGLLPRNMKVSGSIRFRGKELLGRPERELRRLRGGAVAIIFQDPMTALNPVITIGDQIVEAIRIHDRSVSRRDAMKRAIELLELVAIPLAARRVSQFPHEFSGGMRQRVAIAMAMANDPDLLIADEPTTALDVTVQAQIMEVLRRLRDASGVGIILITHDLGLVAGMAEQVAVMYAGRVVERASVDDIFFAARHPYTLGLLASLPKLDAANERLFSIGGAPPAPSRRPPGCAFAPRCTEARPLCRSEDPPMRRLGRVDAACHFPPGAGDTAQLQRHSEVA